MAKIRKGLWYLCKHYVGYFNKGYWYYSPADGYLKGNDNQPHRVFGFHYRYFGEGIEFSFNTKKRTS